MASSSHQLFYLEISSILNEFENNLYPKFLSTSRFYHVASEIVMARTQQNILYMPSLTYLLEN